MESRHGRIAKLAPTLDAGPEVKGGNRWERGVVSPATEKMGSVAERVVVLSDTEKVGSVAGRVEVLSDTEKVGSVAGREVPARNR